MAIAVKQAEDTMQPNLEQELEAELYGETELESEVAHEGELELESELAHEGELESEGELEGEAEFEGEGEMESEGGFLGSIASGLGSLLGEGEGESELESESELELESEFETEGELETEGEFELEHGEQFFGKIFRGVGRLVRRAAPILKRIARVAAPIVGKVVSGVLPGPFGALASQGLGALTGSLREDELESHEMEFEHEHELGEHEVSHELGEHEVMAEAMAHYAAQAEHELEAEAMTGAATTITLSAGDRRTLRRLVPHLVRGAAILTRILRLRRRTRPMVRLVPTIVRRTAHTLRRTAATGRPVTRRRAGAIMARQTRRVLSSPRYCAAVLRRNIRATRAVARPRVMRRRSRAV
jgi:hypothetical protein